MGALTEERDRDRNRNQHVKPSPKQRLSVIIIHMEVKALKIPEISQWPETYEPRISHGIEPSSQGDGLLQFGVIAGITILLRGRLRYAEKSDLGLPFQLP